MRPIFIILLHLITLTSFSQLMPKKISDFDQSLMSLNLNEKIQKIDKALKKTPNEPWYYWMKASAYHIMGDELKTLENYNKSLAIDSNFSAGHGSLARYLYSSENPRLEEALMHINKAIKLEPDGEYYHVDRGNIYLLSKEYELAIAEANIVISGEAFIQEAHKLIVKSLYAQAKKEDLKTYLQKNDLTAWGGFMETEFDTLLGDLYLEFGDKKKACKCYNSAAEPYLMMGEELPLDISKNLERCK